MNKEDMINFLNGRITELKSLKKFIADETSVNVIDAKIDTLEEVLDFTTNARVPYELI